MLQSRKTTMSLSYVIHDTTKNDFVVSDIYTSLKSLMKALEPVLEEEIEREIKSDSELMHKLDWFENEYPTVAMVYSTAITYDEERGKYVLSEDAKTFLNDRQVYVSYGSTLMKLIHTPMDNPCAMYKKTLGFVEHA